MPFSPADTLKSRSYIGLIVAQFLAAFNDQAIHASAMFYAIHQETLSEAKAISLMPILFFTPWAIFCTLAGYLADRYSKRTTLVFWKVAEVGITLVALAGFWLGTAIHNPLGPWVVLSCVFLMGTHSAFFVPAKYGALPEILQPHLLSKGNGILESTSFLAVILGTVSGGILSSHSCFRGSEYYIGLILFVLAAAGAVASFVIERIPAANPTRPFPINLFRPLYDNLRMMLRARPLALAVLGIAFFTFMVAFMRATMYEHGESQHPRWDEFRTSVVVATVALGVGLGSPLAGSLSGGKVELGLVPLGAIGMIVTTAVAAFVLFRLPALIVCLVLIGFFSGFYIVPLYTLLQHRAPKTSKGDLIATSNFINVTGAILASLLFFVLVQAARFVGIAKPIPQQDIVTGRLVALEMTRGRHPGYVRVVPDDGQPFTLGRLVGKKAGELAEAPPAPRAADAPPFVISADDDIPPDTEVAVSRWKLSPRGVDHYEVRPAEEPLEDAYDQELVPRFLFLGASLMTLGILILLCRQLPDFFVRALLWLRSHGRYRLRVVGIPHLPANGPVILATNCDRFESCMQVVAATDRFTRFVLLESEDDPSPPWLLRLLARRTGLVALRRHGESRQSWDKALDKAARSLDQGNIVGVTADGDGPAPEMVQLLDELRARMPVPILPVYCGELDPQHPGEGAHAMIPRVQVVIGHALPPEATAAEIRDAIHGLGEWAQQTDRAGESPTTAAIPKDAIASRRATVSDHPGRP
jgi:MFS family permease